MARQLTDKLARIRVGFLAPNAVRITHALPGEGAFPPERPWLEHVLLEQPALAQAEAGLDVRLLQGCVQVRAKGALVFSEAAPARLGLKKRSLQAVVDIPKAEFRLGLRRVDEGVRLRLAIEDDEAFYGWGEWFNAFQRKSGRLRLRIRDAIALLQDGETYSAIPVFYSSRGYAFWLLNSHTSRWRIEPEEHYLEMEADGPGADYILIYGPSFKRILATYTALTGRPPLLPRWAFGLWVTSYPQGHQDSVLEHVEQHRQRGIPLDALILDYHWEEGFHNFRWRKSLFPEPERMIASLKESGVRLGLILTPFVNQRTRPLQKKLLNHLAHNLPPGLEGDDERALPEFEEARAKGYLAHENARWWFGVGGMPDFANPQAAGWWNRLMAPLYAQGVDFFKNDDGEYLPEDARSVTGMDGGEYHNLYGFYYGRAIYEGMAALPSRPLIYARSVWAGSQRYPALFLGDQKPTYQGIRSTLRAGLNLGMLGFAYWTADVFGLDGKTIPEMHMRYAQWALLVPVARYFWRPPQIDDTRFPWSHGPEVEDNFRKYAELRYRLLPLYCALAWQAYQSGLPILRPLLMEFQDDPRLAGIDDQALLGDSLMLCPVVEPGATSRFIQLPAGYWFDFWSRKVWRGPGRITYPAPLDCLPLLVRGSAILPLGPALQRIPDDHRFDRLELHVWPPYPAQGELYEDDGCSLAYQQGAYRLTRFQAQVVQDPPGLVFSIEPLNSQLFDPGGEREIELILHYTAEPERVLINRAESGDWRYDPQVLALTVPLAHKTGQPVMVQVLAKTPKSGG